MVIFLLELVCTSSLIWGVHLAMLTTCQMHFFSSVALPCTLYSPSHEFMLVIVIQGIRLLSSG